MYKIYLTVDPPDAGTVTGGGYASDGMTVTVEATPSGTNKFKGWEESKSSITDEKKYTFVIDKDRNLVAIFDISSGELVYFGQAEALSAARYDLSATTVGWYALFGG